MRPPPSIFNLSINPNFDTSYVEFASSGHRHKHLVLMACEEAHDPRQSPLSHYPVKFYADQDHITQSHHGWAGDYLIKIV